MKRERRRRRRQCNYCAEKIEHVDYKDIPRLRRYITEKGKILPRRITGNCAHHQSEITKAIKRARNIALLPFTSE